MPGSKKFAHKTAYSATNKPASLSRATEPEENEAEAATPLGSNFGRTKPDPLTLTPATVSQHQKLYGNQAVQRMLANRRSANLPSTQAHPIQRMRIDQLPQTDLKLDGGAKYYRTANKDIIMYAKTLGAASGSTAHVSVVDSGINFHEFHVTIVDKDNHNINLHYYFTEAGNQWAYQAARDSLKVEGEKNATTKQAATIEQQALLAKHRAWAQEIGTAFGELLSQLNAAAPAAAAGSGSGSTADKNLNWRAGSGKAKITKGNQAAGAKSAAGSGAAFSVQNLTKNNSKQSTPVIAKGSGETAAAGSAAPAASSPAAAAAGAGEGAKKLAVSPPAAAATYAPAPAAPASVVAQQSPEELITKRGVNPEKRITQKEAELALATVADKLLLRAKGGEKSSINEKYEQYKKALRQKFDARAAGAAGAAPTISVSEFVGIVNFNKMLLPILDGWKKATK